jgi:hypothetical protein
MSMDFTSRELALLMVATDSMSNMTTVPSEREDLIKLWERFREEIEHTVEHQIESSDPDQALKEDLLTALKESIQDMAAQENCTIESLVQMFDVTDHTFVTLMGVICELEEDGIIALPKHHVEGFVRLA